ncbi:ABC transporter ATP-binding protein [Candidatus Roseilinea sp. NK_OTU-006]|jgi:sulfonate transport system ATP-binding protein|uniref:ABC transporter ATP-binding protein n=1 Tax=Candidatus Roseilinea sp. NK_OTU-006 TaxID=2704250 RepID=UPI00145C92D6|nr:ABC transporter ATP-binding protein [Candidatus Roseilinea sp. NK_OTU-006]
MSSSIKIERVTKRFDGNLVLNELSLDVRPSEIVSLIGPSGCGKSTLLRLLSGLERDYDGRLLIDDQPVTGPSRAVGLMFQEPRLMPWLNVRDNVRFGLRQENGAASPATSERMDTWLRQVKLDHAASHLPRQFSGGMAQRAALARSLATEPGVLLLDEPFSAVDALTRMRLQELLLEVWQRTQVTMVLVTHDLDESLYLSDRVVVMSSRPASVREVLAVKAPRPRDRRDPELLRLRAHLLEALDVVHALESADLPNGIPFGV